MQKKKTYLIISGITGLGSLIALFFTINYDLYNYHLWAYTAVKYGLNQIYNNALYFDRAFDYLPIGGYMEIFAGKIASYFNMLSISNVPMLFVYKIIPLIFMFLLMRMIVKNFNNNQILKYIIIMSVPLVFIASLYGENDITICYFLVLSIISFEKGDFKSGMFFSIINLTIKQTSLFFVAAILFYYLLRSEKKYQYIRNVILWGAGIFAVSFSPFIIGGNLISALRNFLHNTLGVISPISCMAFNAYSIIPNAKFIDFNYKFGLLSIKSYSLAILIILSIYVISRLRKDSIWKVMLIISLIWYNLHVGLHTHHMVYVLLFLTIYSVKYRLNPMYQIFYAVILTLNMLLTQSLFTMNVFGYPSLNPIIISIFSACQLMIAVLLILIITRNGRPPSQEVYGKTITPAWILTFIIFFLIVFFVPGRFEESERDWINSMIVKKHLIDYSNDHYIEADIVSRGPFSNYLGIRMSDGAYFTAANEEKYRQLTFMSDMEYGSSGLLYINDKVFNINAETREITLDISKIDTLKFSAVSKGRYSIISLYNIVYE